MNVALLTEASILSALPNQRRREEWSRLTYNDKDVYETEH